MDRSVDPVRVFHLAEKPSPGAATAERLEATAGHPIRVVGSAGSTAAPDRLDDAAPDCLVVERRRDGEGWIGLLRAVGDHAPGLPVIVFARGGDEGVARDAFRAGASDYVPHDGDDGYAALATRIAEVVAERRAGGDGSGRSAPYPGLNPGPGVRPEPDSGRIGPADGPGVVRTDGTNADGGNDGGANDDGTDADRGDRYRTGLEGRVLDASTTLTGAAVDELDTKIEWTLESVGGFVGADRCRLFRRDPDHAVFDPTHQWTTTGVASRGPSFDARPDGPIGWLVERLDRFENVRVGDTGALPAAAAPIRERCVAVGVRSFLAVPLVSEWELLGFLTFETEERPRQWGDHEVRAIRTLGDLIAQALTGRRRIEELERRNEQLDQFASSVSHDLRNPINVASGFLAVARETGEPSYLDRVEGAVDRMELLVDDLLALAREGRTVGETTPIALDETVRRAWADVETGDVTLDVDADVGRPRADEPRLRRVLENLFRNAVEHGGSTTRIRVGPLADGAGFFVADDGDGIPAGRRADVFDHGHTGSEDGTGFGLAIVERIVEAHGWSVAAGGSSSGGARFEIRTGAGRDVGAEPGDGDGDWNGNGNGGEEGCPSVTPGSAASED